MRNDAIERALMANDASLLREVRNPRPTTLGDPDQVESDASSGLPEFPEIAWRGVFAEYRAAMVDTTEASDVAHFASLWATCAVVQGRRTSMYAGERIFPNVYIALFGATGDKKTTAMRRPKNLGL